VSATRDQGDGGGRIRDVGAVAEAIAVPEQLTLGRPRLACLSLLMLSTAYLMMPWKLANDKTLPADAEAGLHNIPINRFDHQSMV